MNGDRIKSLSTTENKRILLLYFLLLFLHCRATDPHCSLLLLKIFISISPTFCCRVVQLIWIVTGVLQELETICLKSDPCERNEAALTQSTSSQTSVTPGFASILSPFSSPPVARFRSAGGAILHLTMCKEKKKSDHMCQEYSESEVVNVGRWFSYWLCTVGTVCLSNLSLGYHCHLRQHRWPRHHHTHLYASINITQSSSQVWQTGTYPSCHCL